MLYDSEMLKALEGPSLAGKGMHAKAKPHKGFNFLHVYSCFTCM